MTNEDLELINLENVLDMVEKLDNPTRAVIASELGLSRTTLTNVTNQLVKAGLLSEAKDESYVQGSRGKPGTVLRLSDKWYALGAAFYSDYWHVVLCSLDGEIVEEYVKHIDKVTPSKLISTLLEAMHKILDGNRKRVFKGIGLGLPGVVNSDKGSILWAYDLKWNEEIDVKTPIQREFGFDVYTLNRYTLAGLAEFRYANRKKIGDMIYVGLGSGIRSAVFVNGELLKGSSFSAGRIGHIQIDPRGALCECGKRGCLLALANEEALLRNSIIINKKEKYKDSPLYKKNKSALSVDSIIHLADEDDLCAKECMDSIIDPIIQAIGMLIDVINPKMIVLGGPIGYSSNYLVNRVKKAVEVIATETPYRSMIIEQGKIKDKGSALGAASLVLDHKLELAFKSLPL